MNGEGEVRSLCGDCLRKASSLGYEREGSEYRKVGYCCGHPGRLRPRETREIAEELLRRENTRGKGVRARQPATGDVLSALRQNPLAAGAAVGLGFLVLASVGSESSEGGTPGEAGTEAGTEVAEVPFDGLEERGEKVVCPECGKEVKRPGFVGHAGFSDDHELDQAEAAEMLKQL